MVDRIRTLAAVQGIRISEKRFPSGLADHVNDSPEVQGPHKPGISSFSKVKLDGDELTFFDIFEHRQVAAQAFQLFRQTRPLFCAHTAEIYNAAQWSAPFPLCGKSSGGENIRPHNK
jgi:hypothetical protein